MCTSTLIWWPYTFRCYVSKKTLGPYGIYQSLTYLTHLNVTTVMSFLMRASYTASRGMLPSLRIQRNRLQRNCIWSHRIVRFNTYFYIIIGTGTPSSISTLAFQSTSGYSFSLIHPITLKGMVCDCFRLCVWIVRGSVGRKQTAIPLTIITVLSCGCSTCHFQITNTLPSLILNPSTLTTLANSSCRILNWFGNNKIILELNERHMHINCVNENGLLKRKTENKTNLCV